MENVLLIEKGTCNCADSLVKPMENEEILLNGMKIDAKSIKFPCKTNEILTFRVQKRYQIHSKPCKTNGKQANGLAAGRRGPIFFAQTIFFARAKKVSHMRHFFVYTKKYSIQKKIFPGELIWWFSIGFIRVGAILDPFS